MYNHQTNSKMKKRFKMIAIMTMMLCAAFVNVSCDKKNGPNGGDNGNGVIPSSGPIEVSIAGSIDHNNHTPGQTGTVTFNRFPNSVSEFKQVKEQIGREPHGAVALELMAFEMYRRNRKTGEECIQLINTKLNVKPCTDRLRELFGKDGVYARPYQIAAFLRGASPSNGYTPQEPYTIEVSVNTARPYQTLTDYNAKVLYLEVKTGGKGSGRETVEVLKTTRAGEPSNGEFFIVMNCPGVYAQVQPAATAFPGLK